MSTDLRIYVPQEGTWLCVAFTAILLFQAIVAERLPGHPYADDPTTFRKMIAQLWFEHYSRSHGPPDTSGFEHVFIGEDIMAAVKFTWKGDLKRIGSMLIGTSPEYDMALYTLCFLSRRGREPCKVDIDGCPLNVVSYETIQNDKVFIGTAYPKLGRDVGQCEK